MKKIVIQKEDTKIGWFVSDEVWLGFSKYLARIELPSQLNNSIIIFINFFTGRED